MNSFRKRPRRLFGRLRNADDPLVGFVVRLVGVRLDEKAQPFRANGSIFADRAVPGISSNGSRHCEQQR